MKVIFVPTHDNPTPILPVRMTDGSAGYDVAAFHDVTLLSGETRLVRVGLRVLIPKGYELQVRSRSGLAAKSGVSVLNSPGTIDSDYRGELFVILHNHSNSTVELSRGTRIAQLVLQPVVVWSPVIGTVEYIASTGRTGGFGSTGLT